MPNQPYVSVVIPAHNRVDVLRRVLGALQQQSYPRDLYEVIVVDDFSDRPLEEALGEDSVLENTRFLRNPVNLGDRRSRDTGVQATTGELIILLDSDMVANPDLIASHVVSHPRGSRCTVTGHFRHPPSLGLYNRNAFSTVKREYRMRLLYPKTTLRGSATTANMSLWKEPYLEARALADARWERQPEFRETLGIYGWKDIEFMTALTLVGVELRYSWDAWAWHHDSHSIESRLHKALKLGIGICRYAILYPDKAENVLHAHEKARLAGRLPLPTFAELAKVFAHLKCWQIFDRIGWPLRARNHSGPVTRFYHALGIEVAKREGFDCLLQAAPTDLDCLVSLVRFVRAMPVKRQWWGATTA